MPRIDIKPRPQLDQYEGMFQNLESFFGYMPNDYLTMGHRPGIMKAVSELTNAVVFAPGKTSLQLRLLVAYISSRSAQCMYCAAHCGTLASQQGISLDKLQNIMHYESYNSFSPLERSALRIAHKASQLPNAVSDEDFAELKYQLDDEGCAEILGVISLMGFYNRWNDTIATTLERTPFERSDQLFRNSGWEAGKHAPSN
jgi:uncharacterized peroxidase-related enzyme